VVRLNLILVISFGIPHEDENSADRKNSPATSVIQFGAWFCAIAQALKLPGAPEARNECASSIARKALQTLCCPYGPGRTETVWFLARVLLDCRYEGLFTIAQILACSAWPSSSVHRCAARNTASVTSERPKGSPIWQSGRSIRIVPASSGSARKTEPSVTTASALRVRPGPGHSRIVRAGGWRLRADCGCRVANSGRRCGPPGHCERGRRRRGAGGNRQSRRTGRRSGCGSLCGEAGRPQPRPPGGQRLCAGPLRGIR